MPRLFISVFLFGLAFPLAFCWINRLTVLDISVLGSDPQTSNRLNGESFQQDALVTFNGYQYAAFWLTDSTNVSIRHATISRRMLKNGNGKWESAVLNDYNQTEDDSANTISLGISRGDGVLHMIFDQNDNLLHYRSSIPCVATDPEKYAWTPQFFGSVINFLPGLEALDTTTHFSNITYPRFLSVPPSAGDLSPGVYETDLVLEMRFGQTGLGSDWLYRYAPGRNWTVVGPYLQGVNNSASVNGIDFDTSGKLHATWTYRDFVNETAGSNGPENNHDLVYSYSPDLGYTWMNNWQQPVGDLEQLIPVKPISPGITIFSIPKYSGIQNQEAQAVDKSGRVHVLNRENTTGTEQWYHYWRNTTTFWTRTPLPLSVTNITLTPSPSGKRGKIIAPPCSSDILAVLPSNEPNSSALVILASSAAGQFSDWRSMWEAPSGFDVEPLYDRYRLDSSTDVGGDGVLSLFYVNETKVSVIDFSIEGLD
ncbi:hypothetical protein H0H92_008680 [Tricholoma furcatifolium]|nr:hypothetical protein H0H92_008680 [Tricholoma furcatifolium]